MTTRSYRLIDTAGSELGIVELDDSNVAEDAPIELPEGGPAIIIEIYDDEDGKEGGVEATLVVGDPDEVA